MGTAFSSSLFGLAGSLVLGFLDLQSSSAQNRFYVELEDWLSTVTDISSEAVGGDFYGADNNIQLQHSIAELSHAIKSSNSNDKIHSGLVKLADGLTEALKTIKANQAATQRLLQVQEQNTKILKSFIEKQNPPRGGQ